MNELTFRPVRSESEMWFVSRLYTESFPENERRDLDAWVDMSFHSSSFTNNIIFCGGVPAGLLTVWLFPEFCYIEHFAVSPQFRGRGIGGQILDMLLRNISLPVVLEVEIPLPGDITEKRVNFYKRHGFVLRDVKYMQPPYSADREGEEMRIMYCPHVDGGASKALKEDDIRRYIVQIYSEVYGIR